MISLILPVYNNLNSLNQTLNFFVTNQELLHISEIIVIDDGSRAKDRIKGIVKKYDNIIYVRNKMNQGKGATIQKGVFLAKHEFITFCDSDFPFTEKSITSFLNKLISGESDILIGNRYGEFLKENKTKISTLRLLLSKSFSFMSKSLLRIHSLDVQCGIKGFKADKAQIIFSNLVTNRFSFDTEVIFRGKYLKLEINQVAVRLKNQETTSIKIFKDGITMLLDLFKIRIFSIKKLGTIASSRS